MLYAIYLLPVLLLILNVDKGNCLRCYSCSSKENRDCLRPIKSNLQMENCSLPGADHTKYYAQRIDESFGKIFQVDTISLEPHVPVNCLKQITRVGGREYILRGCQLAPSENLDICKKVKEQDRDYLHTDYCSLCSTDGCNKASNLLKTTNFIIYITALILLAYYYRN